jgi:hypothetical protein
MSDDNPDQIKQLLTASLAQAMAAAQAQLEAAELADCLTLAELATRGLHVVHWRPPGPARPICAHCRRVDQWYQCLITGRVRCYCELPVQ